MRSPRELTVEPVGLEADRLPKPLDLPALFGDDHPVELEIGMGKGTFLIEQAKARPQVNFLGIEYARWFWRYASDRLRRAGCGNVHTVRAEASFFLREFIGDGALAAVHIYFPDPWPKSRHHKRRLIQPPFALELARVLIPGGRVRIVTDHREYFEQIQQVIEGSPLKKVEYDPPGSAAAGECVGSNFERKYRRQGRPFYSLAAIRPSINPPPAPPDGAQETLPSALG
jgi:tRNA (guanine-N7-)-methyltransferase